MSPSVNSDQSTTAAFRVLHDGVVVLETDDWVEAGAAALTPWPYGVAYVKLEGTHPTHTWDTAAKRCTSCGAWDNGSYGSQSPCGYDWSSDSLVSAIERERAARVASTRSTMKRERYEIGLHEDKYVVMDRDALRMEDLIVASYDSRSAAVLDVDHRNAVALPRTGHVRERSTEEER